MSASLAEVTRGSMVEAVHTGSVVAMDADGTLVAWAGDRESVRFFRSSAKPFQAVPLVAGGGADRFGVTTEELALSCASHDGTDQHQQVVKAMLEKIGLDENHLRCGASQPLEERENAKALLGLVPTSQLSCECSGEHAGMLAACLHAGWPVENYLEVDHPLQREIQEIVAAACGVSPDELEIATDGCSLPTFGAELQSFARAYAVLADPENARWKGQPSWQSALIRLREAMLRHPFLLSGEGETDTVIMQRTNGRVVAKLGAEGLLCLAIPSHRLGIAISDDGGSSRSLGPAAVAVIEQLGIEDDSTIEDLTAELCPQIRSFAGDVVGETRPALELQHA